MIFDQSGSLANVKRHDYLPFGEELFAGTGGRTTMQGYTGDSVRQKFTLKERDNETGLDYFNARYFASTHGRFTSPDPLLESGTAEVPQSWNRYSYVLNNPLAFIDPTGLIWGRVNGQGTPIWYKDQAAMEAAGAEAFSPPGNIYQAEDGRYIALNPNGPGSQPNYQWNPYDRPEDRYYKSGWEYTRDPNAPPDPMRGLENKFDHLLALTDVGQLFFNLARGAATTLLASEAATVTNPVPSTLARVIPGEGPFTTLGRPGVDDVFVTAADDIAGMSASQLGSRLGIPNSKTFTVIEFPTPTSGLASPIFRTNPGFVGFGRTSGGAREFVIPNGPIPANAIKKVVQ
jgi:RHS repeat-associated protein